MTHHIFLVSNADFDSSDVANSHVGADSNAGAGSTMESVPVPTLLVTSKQRFQFQNILEPHHP